MKAVKRGFCVVLACLLCLAILGGCSSSLENKIEGSWKDGNSTVTFYDDGTFTSHGTGQWHIVDDNVLKMTYADSSVRTLKIEKITSDAIIFENDYTWEKAE